MVFFICTTLFGACTDFSSGRLGAGGLHSSPYYINADSVMMMSAVAPEKRRRLFHAIVENLVLLRFVSSVRHVLIIARATHLL